MSIDRPRYLASLGLACGLLAAAAPAAAAGTGVWTAVPPQAGRVQALAAFPGSGTVFAGTAAGGVFRTVDRGATWQAANDGLLGLDVRQLVAAPGGGTTLYAATDSGISLARDGVPSWQGLLLPGGPPTALAVAAAAPATLYAADAGALYQSGDGGAIWTRLPNLPPGIAPAALAVDAGSAQHVYLGAGNAGTVCISRTGGAAWRQVGLPGARQVLGLTADPARPGSVYAATDAGIFVSRNGGGAWSPVAGLPAGSFTAVGLALDAPGILYAAIDRARGRLFKSSDSGATWSLVLGGAPFTAIAGDPLRQERVYVAAGATGVFHGPLAGGAFAPQQGGFDATSVNSLAIDARTPGLLYALAQFLPPGTLLAEQQRNIPFPEDSSLQVSTDGGATWKPTAGVPFVERLIAAPAAAATGGAYALAGGVDEIPGFGVSNVFHTADGGATWLHLAELGLLAFDLAAAPAAPGTLIAAGYIQTPSTRPCPFGCQPAVAVSADGGATWTYDVDLPIDTDVGFPTDPALWAVRFDPNDARTAYVIENGQLIATADGGQTWTPLTAAGTLVDLAVDPGEPRQLYAVRADGTAVGSADAGQTWQPLGTGLPVGAVRRLASGPGAPLPGLYAATSQGVFASADRGATWSALGSGLAAPSVLTVAVDPHTAIVYAGTEGGGGLFALTPH